MPKINEPRFVTPLDVRRMQPNDGDLGWKLLAPLVYASAYLDDTVSVPLGYETDFASVPRAPFIYWLCGDTSTEASVVHDYLYSMKPYPRYKADAVLREASCVSGVPKWRRWLMWAGVRVFGGSHW